ncbi:NACHT, LRR and PYD domains-containing protein 3-like isoform X2 [Gopherus evgoodei]|uniref:NACHT, LRR and PYD domains-containing protein 3-like isoform X2 n=1 Tax=Gopherus evgoodei TaxID=1825980 RepID=UPI0011CFDC6C|nr:NACHT, LRR and PYD domains-containing protein 3-like isoform X2 [Gopherus evgoodei]
MSRKTPTDVLLQGLEDLAEQDFKKFIHKLSEFAFDDKPSIPWCKLEKVDRIDAVRLLKERYDQENAVDIAIKIFTNLNLNNSAMKLKQEKETGLGPRQTPERSANAYRVKYREHIRNKYTTIKDMNSRLGENVKLNSRYTKLIIVNEHRPKKQREHEIMALGRRHAEIMAERASPITIANLFESDRNGQSPQIVVLQGAAGIGKTLTAKKIMLDWANEGLYQNRFDYVFYINCREINFVREQRSVEDLILENCPDQNAPTKEILMNPEKLLFIIDGFDELRFSFNQPTSIQCSDSCEKQPVEIILSSLFRKKVLLKSYLLITTRPIALEKLGQCLKDERYAEILGFSENERKEYFYKFFGNEEQARKAFNFVKDNEVLFTMCFVPLVCWIICTVLKQQMEADEDLAQTSSTITGVYMHYLDSLLKGHSSTSKQQVQGNLKGLCSLAADGIWKKNILFEEEDVKKHGLDKPDALFLNENMFQKGIDCECVYTFIHLSFQEFFAALFYVLEKEETEENSETAIQPVEKLFEKCEKSRNDLMLTVRFLFGLLNKKRMEEMEKKLSCKISPKIKNNLLTWVKEKLSLSLFKYDMLPFDEDTTILYFEYFHCLYEIGEREFVQSAMNHLTELKLLHHTFTKMDQIVLQFCLKNSCKLESVYLDTCTFLTEDLNEDSPRPCKRPHGLHGFLTGTCCRDLADVLKARESLTELDLGYNDLGNAGVRLLCEGLKHPNCKLQKLDLWDCELTGACCGDLANVLSTNQSLRELKLCANSLGDAGARLLCKRLTHPNCKLQQLGLRDCELTGACCGDLAAVLSTSQSLTELKLSGNNLGDAGMRLLCKGLNHPNCKLQKLDLRDCELTSACCGDLAAVLRASWTLTELKLSGNNLGNAGVRLLCEGLKHPNCKLWRLDLSSCFLTDACCGDLATVLRTNQSLTELDLGYNNLGDAGVKLLCEGLKQNCKLQSLNLRKSCTWGCGVTAAGCGDLAAFLKTKQNLTKLYLDNHLSLGDSGVQLLCEGLTHPNCKLETLVLHYCGLTAACCEALSSVLSTSQTLTFLGLGANSLEDSGVQRLCEGLKHPNCKLHTLGVDFHCLTPVMQAELYAVKKIKPDLIIKMQPKD